MQSRSRSFLPSFFFVSLGATAMGIASGCGGGGGGGHMDVDAAVPTFACPEGWVTGQSGGCAPSIVACATPISAMSAACMGTDPKVVREIVDEDGFEGTHLHLQNNGAIGGGWPGALRGTPFTEALAERWSPTAGIPTCPEGWTRATDGTCDPALGSCTGGGYGLPGGQCTHTAESDCEAGRTYADVASEAGTATIRYVRADADGAGADGSEAHPFRTIQAGIDAAGAGGYVLVAPGDYAETLDASVATHVVGLCAARVRVTGSGTAPLVDVHGAGVMASLRGLTLRGTTMGIRVRDQALADIRAVHVDGVQARALQVSGTGVTVTATDLVVTGTLADVAGDRGQALQIESGGRLTVSRAHLADNHYYGAVVIDPGSMLTMSDSVVKGTRSTASGLGRGISVGNRAMGMVTRTLVDDNQEFGIEAEDRAMVQVSDCVVKSTRESAEASPGSGIAAARGGTLTAMRVLVEENVDAGASALAESSVLTITDSVVRRNVAGSDGHSGLGLVAAAGGRIRAMRVRVDHNTERGAYVVGTGSAMELTDTHVTATQPRTSDGNAGFGVTAADGASLTITNAYLESNRGVGVLVRDMGTAATLVNVQIRQTAAAGARLGRGVSVQAHATLEATRLGLFRNREVGLYAGGGSHVVATDVVVEQFANDDAETAAAAVHAQGGASIDLRKATLGGPDATCVAAVGADTMVTVREALLGTSTGRGLHGFGHGVDVADGAHVTVMRSYAAGLAQAAFVARGEGSVLEVSDGLVSGTAGQTDLTNGGGGALALDGASLTLERIGFVEPWSFGLAATRAADATGASTLMATDVLVSTVKSPTAAGAATTTYGLYAGDGATVTITRATVDRGTFGLAVRGGALSISTGVIANQSTALGVRSADSGAPALVSVSPVGNASDEVRTADVVDLPSTPAPVALCTVEQGCS